MSECQNAPPGWKCTRDAGHDGPCAAVKVSRWQRFTQALGNALGEWMFGGNR